ncbi:MAG: peptidoglycan DD-metalloendopeptidase family protein [Polaribacter sp.]|uniref:peptidoglycan DD-metalloendopeptidase family protein n=1 Tax=Polaribacter sp. TaxID=1920175 RepID=UPI002F353D16
MKKTFLFITLFLIGNFAYSQTEKTESKTIAKNFEDNYNKNYYEAIFIMFSSEMQQALPIDKTIEFLTGLKSQAGKITNRTFVKYENGTYASYKTIFERAVFTLNISINKNSKINGLFAKPFKNSNLPQSERNITELKLPFKNEWTVVWGGDTKELNYHIESEAQKNAFDIIIKDKKGKSYKTDGKANDDYYAFGKELIAPCDGEIVLVVNGIKDNKPGELNPVYIPGNTVIIKTENNEYLFFAHFKQNSIKVKQGQIIKQGELLGLCGNSGNSSEPHLHFHIQNVENMNVATGVKCYFKEIYVNGELKKDYSPIQNEKIKNK